MNPALVLPLAKNLWLQSKWIVVISLLCFTHYVAYNAGQKNILRENAKEQSKLVLQARKEGAEAVKRASEATARLKDLEKKNDELTKELDAIPDRVLCPVSPDELRILQDIKDRTKR